MLSPQFSHKHQELFRKQRSPSFRTKRVPSVQEVFLNQYQHRTDSPKSTQEVRRKKSQIENGPSHSAKKKNSSQTKEIFMEIQDLKEEYRELKEAYKGLVQERVRHVEELKDLRDENETLRQKIDTRDGGDHRKL